MTKPNQNKIKISGFTILRNIVKYHYPFIESIHSILPIVDEMVVGLGDSIDNTESLLKTIDSPKIKIVPFKWDDSIIDGGRVLSIATNHALQHTSGDWCFYLQADEILHENEYPSIVKDIHLAQEKNYQAVSFKYYHFKGDYWSVNPWAYRREIRAIKNNSNIESVGDACTFHRIDTHKPPRTFNSSNHIFHYGWVKTPEKMLEKNRYTQLIYHGNKQPQSEGGDMSEKAIYDEVQICRIFKGIHPKVMHPIIKDFPVIKREKSRWQYWSLYRKFLKYGWV